MEVHEKLGGIMEGIMEAAGNEKREEFKEEKRVVSISWIYLERQSLPGFTATEMFNFLW